MYWSGLQFCTGIFLDKDGPILIKKVIKIFTDYFHICSVWAIIQFKFFLKFSLFICNDNTFDNWPEFFLILFVFQDLICVIFLFGSSHQFP